MKTLSTIGYESASLDDFIATLLVAGVEVVYDIRELPISRRKGFSKSALAETLRSRGITYTHVRALGDPKAGRDAARAGRMDDFNRIFLAQLSTQEAQEALQTLASLTTSQAVCLLCYERDHRHCHRSLVVDAISAIVPLQVKHLGVRKGLANDGKARTRTGADTR